MTSSSVTLFYGLWVKTWSLAFAAEAHEQVQSALLAIDLICLRRGKGALVAEEGNSKRTAVDLPAEVWEMVKQEVIDEALENAERVAIAAARCPRCRKELGEELLSPEEKALKRAARWLRPYAGKCERWPEQTCNFCIDKFYKLIAPEGSLRLKSINRLLDLFGLRLASDEVFVDDASEHRGLDDRLAIALPLHEGIKDRTYPRVSAWTHCNETREFSDSLTYDLSPEALILPTDTDSRFSRLITTYNLRVEDPTGSNAMISCMTKDDGEGRGNAGLAQSEEPPTLKPDQPRWMLWTCADTEW